MRWRRREPKNVGRGVRRNLGWERKGEEGMVDSPGPPHLHGVMQGRQWNLAHDEEDHLGALVSRQRAGKGAFRKKTERGFEAGSCWGLRSNFQLNKLL